MALKLPLYRDGPLVSRLGLGTVKFGRNQGVKYPQGFDLPSDAQILDLLRLAHDLGINLLDTAPAYGLAESRLGQVLPQLGLKRADWVIVSKAGESFENGVSHFDFSGPAIRASVLASLEKLRIDYLDAVLLHSDGIDEAGPRFMPALEALQALKAEGLIRAAGFSGKTLAGNLQFADCADLLMLTYNSAETDQLPAIAAAAGQGKGVLLKKALASGHASDADAALRMALAVPGVTAAVVGSLSPAHLRANAQAAGLAAGLAAGGER